MGAKHRIASFTIETLQPRGLRLRLLLRISFLVHARKYTAGFGMKWSDIDLDRGTLQVRRILSAAKEGPRFTTPKSNQGRSVRLTVQAAQALRDHRKRQVEER